MPGGRAPSRIASSATPARAASLIATALALPLLLAAPGLVWLRCIKSLRLAEVAILSIALSTAVTMLAASFLALVGRLSPEAGLGVLITVAFSGVIVAGQAPIAKATS